MWKVTVSKMSENHSKACENHSKMSEKTQWIRTKSIWKFTHTPKKISLFFMWKSLYFEWHSFGSQWIKEWNSLCCLPSVHISHLLFNILRRSQSLTRSVNWPLLTPRPTSTPTWSNMVKINWRHGCDMYKIVFWQYLAHFSTVFGDPRTIWSPHIGLSRDLFIAD
jgi:hypothetical protein